MDPWLKWAGIVAAAFVAWVVVDAFVLSERPTRAQQEATAVEAARAEARGQRWAYIAKSKEIAPGKALSWIVIPDPGSPGLEFLDIHCLLIETERGTSIVCPSAEQWYVPSE